jgi:signal transduction histidine kinase
VIRRISMRIMNEEVTEYRPSKFRITMLALIGILIGIRIADLFAFPGEEILPDDIFFAVAIVELFLLWFDQVKEKNYILWVQKKKEELREMKRKFTLITSHELRTPITVIKGYLDLIQDGIFGDINERQVEAIKIVDEYFSKLEEMQNNLTRLYAEKSVLPKRELERAPIGPLIRSTAREMMPFVEKRHQKLFIDVEEGIPDVKMDVGGIKQVLANLIINSIKFTPDNGEIKVKARDEERGVRVEVEDNGIGISEDKLTKVFESYYEAGDVDKHTTGIFEFKAGGLGVGLAIARNTIQAHNGEIWVESEEGKYSRFIFMLPKNHLKQG